MTNRSCKLLIYCSNHLSRHIGNRHVSTQNNVKEKLPIFQYASNENQRLIYAWGLADTGALGVRRNQSKQKKSVVKSPARIPIVDKQIADACCGFGFSVFAVGTSSNKLYGTGINTDSQIGYHELTRGRPAELLRSPVQITLPPPAARDTKVLKLSAGRAHLLVLTSIGLFSLGNNSYGQCGRDVIDESYKDSPIIHHIPDIDGHQITDVVCGQDHSLVLTEKGEVYSCGWGADGQTGLGHCSNTSNFTKVTGDIQGEKITKFTCTGDCVLALNDKNELFGWGNSEYGQLHSDQTQVCVSSSLQLGRSLGKIIDIAAGGSFCMVLNDEGHVYVWGYGLLGKGIERNYPQPWLVPPVFFGYNDFQPSNRVAAIYCGIGHLAAVTNLGDLYTWGRNRNGCLGLGHSENQHIPRKVAVGASVLKVACGLDHTIAVCKPFV